MAEPHYARRATDISTERIGELLQLEDDPAKRALLLVLSNISTNLLTNTSTTESIRTDLGLHLKAFNEHVQLESEYINKGKGVWKVLAWVIAICQIIISGAIGTMIQKGTSYDTMFTSLLVTDAKHDARLASMQELLTRVVETKIKRD